MEKALNKLKEKLTNLFDLIENELGPVPTTPRTIDNIISNIESMITQKVNEAFFAGYDSGCEETDEYAYNRGYSEGEQQGYSAGYDQGMREGYESGYRKGYESGLRN